MNNVKKPLFKQRIQIINGIDYVYEDHPYWDASKKQTRHKRIYIGKHDSDGKFIPNQTFLSRHTTKEESSIQGEKIIAKRTYFGATYLLNSIADNTGLIEDLSICFPKDYKQILSLSYYLVLEPESPMYRFTKWAFTHNHPHNENIASQRISEIFDSISEDQKLKFFRLRSQRCLEKEYLAYDTTSISSYSELIEHVKYGHNKDFDPLPQINLALVFGEESKLPVYYRKLPGNITDAKTIRKLLKDIAFINPTRVKFVMDRGFFSAKNIDDLYHEHHKFLIGLRSNTKLAKDSINNARGCICNFHNYDVDQDIYCVTSMQRWINNGKGTVSEKGHRLYVHVYYNGKTAESEKSEFLKKLALTEEALLNKENMDKGQVQLAKRFFITHETQVKGLRISYNDQAIQEHMESFGYFVLISNVEKEPRKALCIYRNKDLIEKAFYSVKNRLDLKRPQVASNEALEGKLFIQFVALILISCIDNTMKLNQLYRNYTMQSLLDELDIIEGFDYAGTKFHIGEVTEKQKSISSFFGVDFTNML